VTSQGAEVAEFIEEFLTLGGSYLGEPFDLLPFQSELLSDIYALGDDGRRRHRTFTLGLPRKNGKTSLAAALGVFHLIADNRDRAPYVIAAAGDRQQARLVFDEVRRMISTSPELAAVCSVFRSEIRCKINGGTFRVVSADAGLQQGLNPSFCVIDEYHIHKTKDLFDALTLGSATRAEPLTLVISTAGFDLESPLGELYRYGRKCESGEVVDDSFGFSWYGPADQEVVDHSDPETWRRFNPAWEIMAGVDEFASAHARTHEAAFIRYRLNGWTSTDTAWLPAGVFEGLATDRRLEPGERVVLGFDGAWQNDSTALIACSVDEPRHLEIVGLWEKPDTQGGHSMGWRTPVHEVSETIREAFETYTVLELAADPWRWEQTLQGLSEEGYPVVEYSTNSIQRMTQATQLAYDSIIDGSISHDGDPALVRHFGNAVLKEDPRRGSRVTKDRKGSSKKIDACVASIIALHRATFWRDAAVPPQSELLVI